MDAWNQSPTCNSGSTKAHPSALVGTDYLPKGHSAPPDFLQLVSSTSKELLKFIFVLVEHLCVWELSLLGHVSEFQHCLFQLIKLSISHKGSIFSKGNFRMLGRDTTEFSCPLGQIALLKLNLQFLDLSTCKNGFHRRNLQVHFQQHLVTYTKSLALIPNPLSLDVFLQ